MSTVINQIDQIENWKKEYANADDIIDAWESGKQFGYDQLNKVIFNLFVNNTKTATAASEELVKYLNKRRIKCSNIRIKSNSSTYFIGLFVLPKEKYLDKKIRHSIYEKALKISDKFKDDLFEIEFTFTSDSGKINESVLRSQGYFLSYSANDKKGKT